MIHHFFGGPPPPKMLPTKAPIIFAPTALPLGAPGGATAARCGSGAAGAAPAIEGPTPAHAKIKKEPEARCDGSSKARGYWGGGRKLQA